MSIQSRYEVDEASGLFIRKDTQDVSDILKKNAEERHSGDNTNRKSSMRKIASIPLVVVEALRNRSMKDGGPIDLNKIGSDAEHAARFTIWLNDRDNYMLRTSEARV